MYLNFQDSFWLAELSYLSAIFQNANTFKLLLQGKGCDVYEAASLRFRRSNQSTKDDFSDLNPHNIFSKLRLGKQRHKPGIKNKINYSQTSRCSTTKFPTLSSKRRLFEFDFSAMVCAALYI